MSKKLFNKAHSWSEFRSVAAFRPYCCGTFHDVPRFFFFLPVPPLCVAQVPSISYPSAVGLSPGLWGVITRVNPGDCRRSPHRPPVEKHSTTHTHSTMDLNRYLARRDDCTLSNCMCWCGSAIFGGLTFSPCDRSWMSAERTAYKVCFDCGHTTSVRAQFVFLFRYDFFNSNVAVHTVFENFTLV